MTNGEKFKTAKERADAFAKFCWNQLENSCGECPCRATGESCRFSWLELPAPEDPLPCPFCGGKVESRPRGSFLVCSCGYRSESHPSREETIAAHNRVARAVMAAKESEAKE